MTDDWARTSNRASKRNDPFTSAELTYIKDHAAYRRHGALITFLVERLIANVEGLSAIVRDLAAVECPVSTIVSYVTGDVDGLCPTCDAVLVSDDVETTDHDAACPWLRAKEWIERQNA